MASIEFVIADYNDNKHCKDLLHLLNIYACDPMGGGTPLSERVKDQLTDKLAKLPHAFSVICYVDGKPAGLSNCFEAFSTFKCKPLVNIHDFVVIEDFRGLGLSQKLLEKIAEEAKSRGCCKLTLEVLDGNLPAKNAYIKFGFEGYELEPEMGKAAFWQMEL